ncbi:MAG: Do family serine endopeptidase [Candidatus Kryptoniota bacterium]
MHKKSFIGAALLIVTGAVFGALLVMSFNKTEPGFGFTGEKVKLGGPAPITKVSADLLKMQDGFIAVAEAVTPTVVSVTVTSTPKTKDFQGLPFWHDFQFKLPEPKPEKGSGSGVIVTSNGYIITNNHVVEGADKNGIKVRLLDKREFIGKLVGTDPTTDVAVIKIDANDLPVAALGNSDSVKVGQWVLAIGNPLNLSSTVTSGIVSAQGRDLDITSGLWGIRNFIQTDAAINPGNSGGALVNLKGEVIGINSAIATQTGFFQGYGFAIPINLVKKTAEDIIAYGRVRRPMLGVQLKPGLDETDARALGLSKPEGVLIQEVLKDSPAQSAGLKPGDLILAVDGKEVNASNELQTLIAEHRPGDVVSLKIYRDGKTFTKDVKLAELSQTELASTQPELNEEQNRSEDHGQVTINKLGITIEPVSEEIKKSAKIDGGAVVSDVSPTGPASDRQIFKNDIIVEIDHKLVRTPKDVVEAVKNKKNGDAVLIRVLTKQGSNYVSRFIAVAIGE